MLYRIASGTVAVASLLAVLALDVWIAQRTSRPGPLSALVLHGSMIPLTFAALGALALRELLQLVRTAGFRPHAAVAGLFCTILLLSPWLSAGRVLGDSPADLEGPHSRMFWLVAAMFATVIAQLIRKDTRNALADIGTTWLIVLYLGVLPSFVVQLRCTALITDPLVAMSLLLVVLAIALAADIGALYVGLAIGKHRLAPSASPGKTVEGFVGGVAASVLVALAFRATCDADVSPDGGSATLSGLVHSLGSQLSPILGRLNYSQVLVFAGVTSILAQMGDLFESILKRSAQVKDSSGLIPGMGGVLDAIDGVIFAGPAAWFLLTFVWEVV